MLLTEDMCIIVIAILGIFLGSHLYQHFFKPWLVEKCTKDIEKNPKWIMDKLKSEYYGFHDIDIILANCTFGPLPRFRWEKKEKRLQFLIPEDTPTRDVDAVARIALTAKIKLKYGLWFPDKPLHWLSILCYMLDGGDIKQEATRWEELQVDKKPLD